MCLWAGPGARDAVQLLLCARGLPTADDAVVAAVPRSEGVFRAVVLLVAALRNGPTPKRLGRLCETFAVSVRAVRRWCRFWRETLVASRVWQAARGHFATPMSADAMPSALLEVFSGAGNTSDRLVAVLRLVSPLGVSSGRAF